MYKRTSTPAKSHSYEIGRIKSVGIQTQWQNFDQLVLEGKTMNDTEFEMFIKVRAEKHYWKLLAERARLQLEDQLQENQQLHQLLDELTKENEQLQIKSEQCEYLNNIFNSIMSENDSGIELHTTNESQTHS
ncbi:unnamed protein product [Adineta ricciae]|uniref:Uncharacterized protein n=1 Tax=Adineta ricciae TaxID=249248 RepID=A0A813UC35_ADIRI|nr:unnamed protein product [Adineta ricciae]